MARTMEWLCIAPLIHCQYPNEHQTLMRLRVTEVKVKNKKSKHEILKSPDMPLRGQKKVH